MLMSFARLSVEGNSEDPVHTLTRVETVSLRRTISAQNAELRAFRPCGEFLCRSGVGGVWSQN